MTPGTAQHEGRVAQIVEIGADTPTSPGRTDRVTGWRAECRCGWHGAQVYPHGQWPTTPHAPGPDEVEGCCHADWDVGVEVVTAENRADTSDLG